MRLLAALALLALAGCDAPPREGGIVSTHPCLDALLIELVADERITAVSAASHDPATSAVDVAWTRHLPAVPATAEAVIARKPSLVLLGSHTPLAMRDALETAGLTTAYFDVPASIAESRAQVRQIARLVNAGDRGSVLDARIEAAVRRGAGRAPVPALVWQGNGTIAGEGTLAHDLLAKAGFYNAARAYGIASWEPPPLDRLAASPPRIVFTPAGTSPALQSRDRLLAAWGRRVIRADADDGLFACGGPAIPRALERMGAARDGL